jgi:oxygen-independent coproporphyrinogen-3 oxidase
VVGFGASAITQLHEGYVQNIKESSAYSDAVAAGRLPVERAYVLSRDERFHREVVNSIMCQGMLDLDRIGEGEGYDPAEVRQILSSGIDRLDGPSSDGLCTFDGRTLRSTDKGRLAVRNIAFLFDPLLGTGEGRYSRTV